MHRQPQGGLKASRWWSLLGSRVHLLLVVVELLPLASFSHLVSVCLSEFTCVYEPSMQIIHTRLLARLLFIHASFLVRCLDVSPPRADKVSTCVSTHCTALHLKTPRLVHAGAPCGRSYMYGGPQSTYFGEGGVAT